MTERRRTHLASAGTRVAFSVRFLYTALALASGVFLVFVAGAGWNAMRWMRRLVRRRPRSALSPPPQPGSGRGRPSQARRER